MRAEGSPGAAIPQEAHPEATEEDSMPSMVLGTVRRIGPLARKRTAVQMWRFPLVLILSALTQSAATWSEGFLNCQRMTPTQSETDSGRKDLIPPQWPASGSLGKGTLRAAPATNVTASAAHIVPEINHRRFHFLSNESL